MRQLILAIVLLLLSGLSFGQSGIHPDIVALNNYSIRRTGHKNVGFSVDEKILKEIRNHKKRYIKYLFRELPDTSKTIVAHLLLLKVTGDTMAVREGVFIDSLAGKYGFDYYLSGLKFRQYLNRKYEVDTKSVNDIRNRWIEVLGAQ